MYLKRINGSQSSDPNLYDQNVTQFQFWLLLYFIFFLFLHIRKSALPFNRLQFLFFSNFIYLLFLHACIFRKFALPFNPATQFLFLVGTINCAAPSCSHEAFSPNRASQMECNTLRKEISIRGNTG